MPLLVATFRKQITKVWRQKGGSAMDKILSCISTVADVITLTSFLVGISAAHFRGWVFRPAR